MSIEELRKTVLSKAKKEAEEIVKQAMEEASRITEEAMKKKKEIVEQEKRKIYDTLKPEVRIDEAKIQGKKIVLDVKREAIEEIYKAIEKRLNELTPEERKRSLENLLREALKELFESIENPTGIKLLVAPPDVEVAEQILREKLQISQAEVRAYEGITGGVIVMCCNDEIRIDNSHEARLKIAMERYLPEALREVEKEL